MGYYSFLRL